MFSGSVILLFFLYIFKKLLNGQTNCPLCPVSCFWQESMVDAYTEVQEHGKCSSMAVPSKNSWSDFVLELSLG